MESEPLMKATEENSVQGVQKSHLRNLMFGNLILFVLTLASHIHVPVQSQYLYRRVAADVFGNSSVTTKSLLNQTCYLNTSDPGYLLQEKAQAITAAKQMQFTIMKSAIAVCIDIMLGAYSDSIGRKFLFACPLTGHFIRYAVVTAIIYWELDLNYFFLSEGLEGLSGGYLSIFLASYAYAADNTPATGSRTIGLAIVEVCDNLGGAASSTASGYFIQDEGFFYPMLTATLLCLVDVIMVLALLPERPEIKRQEISYCISPLEAIRRVFGFYLIEGSRRKKACFILGMLVFIFTCIPMLGGYSIETLFELNLPFCWSPEMIGYYSTARSTITYVIGVPLMRLLQCCCIDEILGVIGSLAIAGADILQGFASTNFMMFAVIVVRIPSATVFPVICSMLSRMAPANRQGSLFASIIVIETLCVLVGTPIFSYIYQKTVAIWRGFTFFTMATGHVFAIIFLIIYIFVSRRMKEDERCDTPRHVQHTEEEEEDLSA